MKTAAKAARDSSPSAEEQLKGFIDKFDPKHQAVIRSVRKFLRKRFPTANEIVYDNYNFFVIGYSPTERPVRHHRFDCRRGERNRPFVLSRGDGADPHKLLQGSGSQNRFLRLPSGDVLQQPEVAALSTRRPSKRAHRWRKAARAS